MNLQNAVSSPKAMRLSMFISRHIPPALGYRLASLLAGMVCRFKPAVYHIVRANLSQVLSPDAGEAVLHQTTRDVFHTATRSYYDLYRAMQLPHEEMVATVELTESAQAVARSTWDSETGTVIVFLHLGSIDLAGPALAAQVRDLQVLVLPDPPAGFQMANEMRRRSGATVTPLCPAAIRQAIRRLKAGGVVCVAGDRPVSDLDEPVSFFGRPARLPSGPVRLALRTGANIVMAYNYLSPETQKYILHMDPPLELIRTGDQNEEIRLNMRLVLDELEAIIRRWPGQWQMFVPLWPEEPEA